MNKSIERTSAALAVTAAIAGGMGGTAIAGAKPETPKQALTRVIDRLEHGKIAHVLSRTVKLPGPVSTAKGRPIIFTANERTYEAYTQDRKPNFHEAPAKLASEMAIVELSEKDLAELAEHSGNTPVADAHLTAAKILVQSHTHGHPVGFSTGGGA